MQKLLTHERMNIKGGKHLTVECRTVVSPPAVHWHSYFEIEIILSGKGRCTINDDTYDIEKENAFLMSSVDFHHLAVDGAVELINISFDESMVDEREIGALMYSKTQKAYRFEREEYERLVNVSFALADECQKAGDCQRQLLQYIIRTLLRKNRTDLSDEQTEAHLLGIRRALVYMELHFKENITLATIAAEAGYNPTYFSKLFRRVSGEGYSVTLNKLRLAYARTLLANGLSVSDACFLSGFGSLSNFLEIFRKVYHISPSEYKKRHRTE